MDELAKKIEDVKNETDPEVLTDLALNNPNWLIRKEVVKNPNLCDPSVFEKVLLQEKEDYICFYAYGRLKFLNPNSKLFLNPKDVRRCSDEDKLIEIIKNSIYRAPSIVGGEKVNRSKVYPYLVCPDSRWKVRYEAANSPILKDENLLREIALKDYDLRVRCGAINNPNLNDQELFCYFALNDCKYSVRCDAAKYIKNESVLKEIIENDSKSCVRVHAISNSNLTDQCFLADLAFNDYDYNVRSAAVLKITDENVLKDIFRNDNHGEVKKTVCKCISDEPFLQGIVNGRYRYYLIRAARSRLYELNNQSSEKNLADLAPIYQFQEMNTTCESIYDLRYLDVLIILKDGTNLTSWDDVDDKSEVLFVSENLSKQQDLRGKYKDLSSLKAIVTTELSDNVISLEDMFFGCFSLVDISSLRDWDVSNICNMNGLFKECNSLNDLSALKDWDVSNVYTMNSMLENCFSLGSISPLNNWNTRNVYDMSHMFDDCHSLEDISALGYWDVGNVENMEYMFSCCNYLEDISPLKDWDISKVRNMGHMFDGCDYLSNFAPLCGWKFEEVVNTESIFANCAITEEAIYDFFNECESESDFKKLYIPLR